MKFKETIKRKHRRSVLVRVGALLAFTTFAGLAKEPVCSVEGAVQADWVAVEKTGDDVVCVKPGVEWSKYARFQIEPSSFAPSDREQVLKWEDAQKLTAFFDAKLDASFRDQPASDGPVLRIKPTIIAVRRSNSAVNAISLVSIKMPLSYGGAVVRFDLIDDATGETVGVVHSAGRGHAWNGIQGVKALGHSRVALNGSAKRIKRDTEVLRRSAGAVESSSAGA